MERSRGVVWWRVGVEAAAEATERQEPSGLQQRFRGSVLRSGLLPLLLSCVPGTYVSSLSLRVPFIIITYSTRTHVLYVCRNYCAICVSPNYKSLQIR